MSGSSNSVWHAYVKYKNCNSRNRFEIVPITDIRVTNDKNERLQFNPKTLKDFNPRTLYTVKSALDVPNGLKSSWFAWISLMGASKEETLEIVKDPATKIRWPADIYNDDQEAESSSGEMQPAKKRAIDIIKDQRDKNKEKVANRRDATHDRYEAFISSHGLGHTQSSSTVHQETSAVTHSLGNASSFDSGNGSASVMSAADPQGRPPSFLIPNSRHMNHGHGNTSRNHFSHNSLESDEVFISSQSSSRSETEELLRTIELLKAELAAAKKAKNTSEVGDLREFLDSKLEKLESRMKVMETSFESFKSNVSLKLEGCATSQDVCDIKTQITTLEDNISKFPANDLNWVQEWVNNLQEPSCFHQN